MFKKGVVAVALWAGAPSVFAAEHRGIKEDFEKYVKEHGKVYEDAQEREVRFQAFADNLEFIRKENAKGHKYQLGINEFADMTPDEFAMTHFGLHKPKPSSMWKGMPYLGKHERSGSALPDSVDWTEKGAVTPVKNQKSCGSCWAFSSTGALEGSWAVTTGQLVSLSEQQLVDCTKKFQEMGCNGGMMDGAFQYAEQTNFCSESSYPYKAKNGICLASNCSMAIPKGGVVGFKDVDSEDTEALMDAVAQQPVSVAIEADQMSFQLYTGGVLNGTCGDKLDHGVLVVGYGTLDGVKYWKVKNSWGPSWGVDGYVRILRGKEGAGECGIKMQPSYPVVKAVSPGPGPAPAPPAPPAPVPPPAPATSHYEKPPCQDDETEAGIQGADGNVCAPECTSSSCPTDTPSGTKAEPQCILQSPAGKKYCALVCTDSSDCPTGAKCANVGVGVCVYSDSKKMVFNLKAVRESNVLV